MISFNKAIAIAQENVNQLVPGAQNIVLEEIIISDDEKMYEVTLSYDLERPLTNPAPGTKPGALSGLAYILGKRKEYKVFLIDRNGQFRGFKRYKGE